MKSTISTNVALSGETLESFPITITQGGHGRIAALCRRGLYRRPYHIAFMETIANAVDSHIQFGAERPVEVSLNPCTLDVSVRDFGPGVSREEARKHLFSYGSSTRSGDNLCVGGFGIGAKAPLCAVERMTVISWNGGMKTIYECLDDGLGGKVRVVSEEKSDEPSGLEVSYNLMESFIKRDAEGNEKGYWLSDKERYQFLITTALWLQLIGLGEGPGRRVSIKSWMFSMVPNPYKEFLPMVPELQKIRDQLAEEGWFMPRLEIEQIPACLLPESMLRGLENSMFKDDNESNVSIFVSNGVHLYTTNSTKPQVGCTLQLPVNGIWSGSPIVKVLRVSEIKVTADRESGTLLQELDDPRRQGKIFPMLQDSKNIAPMWLKKVKGTMSEKMLKLRLMYPIVRSFIPGFTQSYGYHDSINLFRNSNDRVPYSTRMRENREFTIWGSEDHMTSQACIHLHLLVWDKEYPKDGGFYERYKSSISKRIMNGLEPEWIEMMRKLNTTYCVHVFVANKKIAADILEDEKDFDPKTQFVGQVSFELAVPLVERLQSDACRDAGESKKLMYYTMSTSHLNEDEKNVFLEKLREYISGLSNTRKDDEWRYSLTVIQRTLSKLKVTSKTSIEKLKKEQGKVAVIANDNWTDFPDFLRMLAQCLECGLQFPFQSLLIADGYSQKDLNRSKELTKSQMSLSISKALGVLKVLTFKNLVRDVCKLLRTRILRDQEQHDGSYFVNNALSLNCSEMMSYSSNLNNLYNGTQQLVCYGMSGDDIRSHIYSFLEKFRDMFITEIHKTQRNYKDYLLLCAWESSNNGSFRSRLNNYNKIADFKIPDNLKESYPSAFRRITDLFLKLVDKLEKELAK